MEPRRPPPPYPKPSTIILLGKRVRLKNILGNRILESKDAFITESNEFECKYNNTFKIIRTPDFFDEECQNPDQLIIDLMALSLPGPKLFILAIDSENTQEEKVMAQIKQLQNTFGEKITGNLAVTLPDIESFDSLGHLKEKFSIQMTIANENLASQCKEWCSGRQSFQYDCKGYVEGAVQRRKKALEKTSSNDTPLHQDFSSGADLVSELTSHYACAAESKPDEHRGADSLSVTASKLEPAEEQTREVYRSSQPPVQAIGSNPGDSLESSAPMKTLRQIVNQLKPEKKQKQHPDCSASKLSRILFSIVLLGKAGTGKSASANTIMATVNSKHSKCFKTDVSSMPVTTKCQEKTVQLPSGMILRVVDTPDFFHEHLQNCEEQIQECRKYCQEEHCIVLLVLQMSRVSDGEIRILENLEDKLACKIREKTLVLLTHGDDVKIQKNDLERFINEHEHLKKIVNTCNGRCHVFNNKSKDTYQVKELFEKVSDCENFFQKFIAPAECSVC